MLKLAVLDCLETNLRDSATSGLILPSTMLRHMESED